MKKLLISLLLTMFFVTSTVVASTAQSNIVDSMDFQGKGVELTLAQAIDVVTNNNPTINSGKLDLEQAQVEYDKGMSSVRDLKHQYWSFNETSATYLQNVKIVELTTNFNFDNSKRTYDATVAGVKADIESSYFQLLFAMKTVDINTQNYNIAKDLYDKVQKKYSLGLIAKQEVLNSQLNLIKAENDLKTSQDNLKSAKMAFNLKLGNDLMTEIIPKDQLKYNEFKVGSIAKAIESAFTNRYDVKAAEFQYDIENINMAATAAQYTDNTYIYKEEKVKLDKVAKSLDTKRKSVEMEVRNNYMQLLQKQNSIISGQKSVEIASEALKIAQTAFNAGTGLQSDVQNAQVALQKANLGLSQSILDYNLAVLTFQDSIGVGRK